MTLEIVSHSNANNKPFILIADDDVTMSLILSKFWQKEGCRSISVHDGKDVLEACEKELPDIILMDAIMPEMDGFSCCEMLQEKYTIHCPPILITTGLNDSESVDHAFEVGATDYVTKPFHWAVLRQRVLRMFQAHQDHRQLQQALAKERTLYQELKLANKELERLATFDGLTDLANRRIFDERLETEWKRLRREQAKLSLVLVDIDYFKVYNDTYGHLAGDQCLYEVAQIIRNLIRRPADLAARYGGEEFALILPNTHEIGAIFLAERLRQILQEKALVHIASTVKPWVTVSVGVSTMIPTHEPPSTIIHRADSALYLAKAQGRDCVVADNQQHSLVSSH
ncbi:MAG: diguanylate cyclase [Cyanobacteria bacterium P01_F01_bin.150]